MNTIPSLIQFLHINNVNLVILPHIVNVSFPTHVSTPAWLFSSFRRLDVNAEFNLEDARISVHLVNVHILLESGFKR